MLFFARVVPALLAASSFVQATAVVRGDDGKGGVSFSGFVDALRKYNLTDLADNYEKVAKTDEGKEVVSMIENSGDVSVLAPENCAFDSGHDELSARELLYHQIFGTPENGFKGISPVLKRAAESRSASNSGAGVSRGARKRQTPAYQVQVVDQKFNKGSRKRWNDRSIEVDKTVGSAKVVDRFNYGKIIILVIKEILSLPGKPSDAFCKPLIQEAPNGFKKFSEALEKTGLSDKVDDGFLSTVFVPVDESLDCLDKLSKDDLKCILENHFFFGRRVFSPSFEDVGKATAESGKELYFSFENGVNYVCCGDSKARVLRSDVTSAKGVIHVIDKPLKCD